MIDFLQRFNEHVSNRENRGHAKGQTISEKKTALQVARGISSENFSDGCPSRFFLYLVIIVLDKRKHLVQELRCEREFPRDIQLEISLKNG